MNRITERYRKMLLKALKIAAGSCLAIIFAELFQMKNATSAGIITLLTVLDTRKDTIQLTFDRFISFIVSVLLIFACFHLPGIGWVNYGIYLLFMVVICYLMDWQGTVSVNAVIGTHFMVAADYSSSYVINEFFLIMLGTGMALLMNWKMPSNLKKIREDMRKIEDDVQQVLREMAQYLQGGYESEHVWLDLDLLETYLHQGLSRAIEQQGNSMSEADEYYIEYMEMRIQQCAMLQAMKSRMGRIREMPGQAVLVSRYLEYLAAYIHEKDVLEEEIQALNEIFEKMKMEPLPKTHDELENLAVLYHILMDLEEFLFVKQHFIEVNAERPQEL